MGGRVSARATAGARAAAATSSLLIASKTLNGCRDGFKQIVYSHAMTLSSILRY